MSRAETSFVWKYKKNRLSLSSVNWKFNIVNSFHLNGLSSTMILSTNATIKDTKLKQPLRFFWPFFLPASSWKSVWHSFRHAIARTSSVEFLWFRPPRFRYKLKKTINMNIWNIFEVQCAAPASQRSWVQILFKAEFFSGFLFTTA